MDAALTPTFEKPSFFKRLKSMLGVDFYRLFHTPMYYIFLAIAAIIPAMVLTMTGGESGRSMYTNTWQIIAADSPIYNFVDMGKYANMNMVYIFGGIMISIFIGHDYRSGYVKQLFTTHAKKKDYMISKSLTGAFSMTCMCGTYLIGSIAAGLFTGFDFSVNFLFLLSALLGKVIMTLGWSALYTFISVVLRRHFGVTIALSFLLGTGIPVIAAGSFLGNTPWLNLFLYGSSVYACLSSGILTVLVCLGVSLAWYFIYNVLGSVILARSDVY